MKVKNIILDIMSGETTFTFPSGEIADEQKIIKAIGKDIYAYLKTHVDLNTILTSNITHQEKIRITNRLKAFETIFVSLQCNTGVGSGLEVDSLKGDIKADTLAISIGNNISGLCDDISMNLKYDYTSDIRNKKVSLYTLRHTTCPAVHVGCGFIYNYANFKKLEDPTFHSKLSHNLYRGIKNYVEQN